MAQAADVAGLVPESELRRVGENAASLFNLIPRSAELGQLLANRMFVRTEALPRTGPVEVPAPTLLYAEREGAIPARIPIRAEVPETRALEVREAAPLFLKAIAADVLSGFRFPLDVERLQISVARGRNGELTLEVPRLRRQSIEAIANAFADEPDFVEVTRDLTRLNRAPVTFDVPLVIDRGNRSVRRIHESSMRVGPF